MADSARRVGECACHRRAGNVVLVERHGDAGRDRDDSFAREIVGIERLRHINGVVRAYAHKDVVGGGDHIFRLAADGEAVFLAHICEAIRAHVIKVDIRRLGDAARRYLLA